MNVTTVRWRFAQIFAYVLIVIIGMFGFYQVDQQNRARCKAADESRSAQRATVMAVYRLAIGAAARRDKGTLAPEERRQLHDYLVRVEAFKREALSRLHESAACKQYRIQD